MKPFTENKTLLRNYHQAWSENKINILGEMLTEGCINHNLVTGEKRGREFELEACRIWHASFSKVAIRIEHLLAEEDMVTIHWTLTSTHTAPFLGIPATQARVTVPGMEINRIEDGQIAEIWRLSDTMSVMEQLGGFKMGSHTT